MRAVLLAIAILLPALSSEVQAEEKGVLGLGLVVGEPTGVAFKYYLGNDTAIAGAIGGAFVVNGIQVHADYLLHPWILETKPSFVLPAYVGVGVRVLSRRGGGGDEDHTRIGARAVVGILFDFTEVPLDVFVEVAGVGDYRTKGDPFGLDLNVGAGVRYYF